MTTKNISGVHSCISRKMIDCFSWVCLSSPTQRSKCVFVANLAQCTQILSVACDWEWDYSTLCDAKLTGLSSFQKPWKPHRYASGPNFASKICSGSTFFHLWKVVQIFQRESRFCSKISSGGVLIHQKICSGGEPILGGGLFLPWHSPSLIFLLIELKCMWKCLNALIKNLEVSGHKEAKKQANTHAHTYTMQSH